MTFVSWPIVSRLGARAVSVVCHGLVVRAIGKPYGKPFGEPFGEPQVVSAWLTTVSLFPCIVPANSPV